MSLQPISQLWYQEQQTFNAGLSETTTIQDVSINELTVTQSIQDVSINELTKSLEYIITPNVDGTECDINVVNSNALVTVYNNSTTPLFETAGSGFAATLYALENSPTQNVIYIGGTFTSPSNLIASYDISSNVISSISGLPLTTSVRVIKAYSNFLFVGGSFTTAGGTTVNNIARYDVSNNVWSALGSGTNGSVLSIEVSSDGNTIYVGGSFTAAGGISGVNSVAKCSLISGVWTWSAIGSGIAGGNTNALCLSPNNILYAGGSTTVRLSQCDLINSPNTWTQVGGSATFSGSNVNALKIANDGKKLYVGGSFTFIGGIPTNNIVVYNIEFNTWSNLGVGINSSGAAVYSLALDATNTYLFVGGSYTAAGGSVANNIAKCHLPTNTWSTYEYGVNNAIFSITLSSDEQLFCVGTFTSANNVAMNRFCKINLNSTVDTFINDQYQTSLNPNQYQIANVFKSGSVYKNYSGYK